MACGFSSVAHGAFQKTMCGQPFENPVLLQNTAAPTTRKKWMRDMSLSGSSREFCESTVGRMGTVQCVYVWGQFSVRICGLTLGTLFFFFFFFGNAFFKKITTCVPYKSHLSNKINSDDSCYFSRMINLEIHVLSQSFTEYCVTLACAEYLRC